MSRVLVFAVPICLVALTAPVRAQPAGEGKKYAKEFYFDFKGKPLPDELILFGHEIESFARQEPQGLRITLPKNREKLAPVGVKTTFPVRGDFEITFTVEILEVERPDKTSFGVGASVYVNKMDDKSEGATLGRLLRPGNREVIAWDRSPGKKTKFEGGDTPCSDKVLRLRLKRTGPTWLYQWAPGIDGGEFNTIDDPNPDFGTDELAQVVLRCSSGAQPRAVDVRFIAVRIRSGAVTEPDAAVVEPPAKLVPGGAAAPTQGSRPWLLAALVTGLALVFLMVLGLAVWILLRKRGAAEPDAAAISFACPTCERTLKTRADMVGKKVKCKACGAVALVPAS